jgi:hypothetical protein
MEENLADVLSSLAIRAGVICFAPNIKGFPSLMDSKMALFTKEKGVITATGDQYESGWYQNGCVERCVVFLAPYWKRSLIVVSQPLLFSLPNFTFSRRRCIYFKAAVSPYRSTILTLGLAPSSRRQLTRLTTSL